MNVLLVRTKKRDMEKKKKTDRIPATWDLFSKCCEEEKTTHFLLMSELIYYCVFFSLTAVFERKKIK